MKILMHGSLFRNRKWPTVSCWGNKWSNAYKVQFSHTMTSMLIPKICTYLFSAWYQILCDYFNITHATFFWLFSSIKFLPVQFVCFYYFTFVTLTKYIHQSQSLHSGHLINKKKNPSRMWLCCLLKHSLEALFFHR